MKGKVAQPAPIRIEVEKGEDYYWCACGMSVNQPFCDGSHEGTAFSPVHCTAESSGEKWFCGCKQTDTPPFCDGSHNALAAQEQAQAADAAIEAREDGPLVAKALKNMVGPDGSAMETKPVMALCRCGGSSNKPFCDGTHAEIGFSSEHADDATLERQDRLIAYRGEHITIHYNPLTCSHAAECVARVPRAFDPKRKPWIDPDAASVEELKAAVTACPSGALQFSEPGGEPTHLVGEEVLVEIEKDGPYRVRNVELAAEARWAKGQSRAKYVLCRCGQSTTKPFCDGSHRDVGWSDDS